MVKYLPFFTPRWTEMRLMVMVTCIAILGFSMGEIARHVPIGESPLTSFGNILWFTFLLTAPFWLVHIVLGFQRCQQFQLMVPTLMLIVTIGIVMSYRLSLAPGDIERFGAYTITRNQLLRGVVFGGIMMSILAMWPVAVERILRQRTGMWMVVGGSLFLLFLALVRPDPFRPSAILIGSFSVQTTEFIKVSLIIFLAWFIDQLGEEAANPRTVIAGLFVLPQFQLLWPLGLLLGIACVLLVGLEDLGAVLVLMSLFAIMLYAQFRPRIFWSLLSLVLIPLIIFTSLVWQFIPVPARVVDRSVVWWYGAWSEKISQTYLLQGIEEPIYRNFGLQTQQAIYGTTAGGIWGQGIGFGAPEVIPAVYSDMILAGIAEEMGLVVIFALLSLFLILFWRILRVAARLPEGMLFEKLILIGITAHLALQLFIMAAGTWNFFIMTGITVPFVSDGGVAMAINLAEFGIVLALAQRLEMA